MKEDKIADVSKIKVHPGNPYPLGIHRENDGFNFAVTCFQTGTYRLQLFHIHAQNPFYCYTFEQKNQKGAVYCVNITGLPEKFEYQYLKDQTAFQDPYSERLTGRKKWGEVSENDNQSVHTVVLQDVYDWENDRKPDIPIQNVIMYSLHVRGFTKHVSSGIQDKGTFRGITEKISYLKELGINQIELMPAYDFNEVLHQEDRMTGESVKDILNYWGFCEGFYFAPKSSFAKSDDPVTEFKDMVKALHKNGIEIVMQFYFPNSMNHNLIIDCIRHWALHYHIDGIHLQGEKLPVTILAADPLLSSMKLYHNGFASEEISLMTQKDDMRHLALYQSEFAENIRKFLKSDEDMLQAFAYRMRRNPGDTGIINYITEYEGFTLHDLVSYDYKHNETNGEDNRDGNNYNYSWNCGFEGTTQKKAVLELRRKQMKNALVFLLLSQGTPMILAGDEFANSQKGNNNPYCQDNATAWLEWKKNKLSAEIRQFTTNMIHLRKEHPVFHPERELRIMDYISCGYPDLSYHGDLAWYPKFDNHIRHMGMMYCGKYAKIDRTHDDQFFYIAFNMHWDIHEFGLPKLPKGKKWYIKADTGSRSGKDFYPDGEELLLKNQEQLIVADRTIIVLIALDSIL